MKKDQRKINLKEAGITLIALVVTIIILIMLTWVTVNFALGNNGLIQKSKLSVIKYKEVQQNELENMDETAEELVENRLPSEFQEVEYIESTGTQWIDTGIIANNETGLKSETIFMDFTPQMAEGVVETASYRDRLFLAVHNGQFLRYGWNSLYEIRLVCDLKIKYKSSINYLNDRKILFFQNDICMYEQELEGIHNKNTSSILIFRNYKNADTSQCSKKYVFIITQKDKEIWNGIPCYSTTTVTDVNNQQCPKDTIGLYDLVEGKFYTNQGTGEFLKGKDL